MALVSKTVLPLLICLVHILSELILNSLAVFKATLGSAFKLLHHIHAYISVKCLCSTARKVRVQQCKQVL